MGRVLAGAAICEGEACARGRLHAVAWYPGLVLDEAAGEVRGELWRLEDPSVLARLDAYEGCGEHDPPPHEFQRVRATVRRVADAEAVDAWIYAYTRPVDEATRVISGDWRSATPR